ncbi:hypothetical protein [Antarctobacter heliothermus]|uniref:hypothetical protein n=1 Tax=Antarctobacter heliothermus TaxID=74033 RepID=UPI000B77476E|nr:hypothetical protein [Antarctobacter heliothermus]
MQVGQGLFERAFFGAQRQQFVVGDGFGVGGLCLERADGLGCDPKEVTYRAIDLGLRAGDLARLIIADPADVVFVVKDLLGQDQLCQPLLLARFEDFSPQ